MRPKVMLQIEELEERIAPHCWSPNALIGGGASVVLFSTNEAHGPDLCVPGHAHGIDVPEAAVGGLSRAVEGGGE